MVKARQVFQKFTEGNARKFTVSFAFRAHVDVIKIVKGVHYIKASSNKRLKQCVHARTLHVWSTLVAFECTDRKLLSIE